MVGLSFVATKQLQTSRPSKTDLENLCISQVFPQTKRMATANLRYFDALKREFQMFLCYVFFVRTKTKSRKKLVATRSIHVFYFSQCDFHFQIGWRQESNYFPWYHLKVILLVHENKQHFCQKLQCSTLKEHHKVSSWLFLCQAQSWFLPKQLTQAGIILLCEDSAHFAVMMSLPKPRPSKHNSLRSEKNNTKHKKSWNVDLTFRTWEFLRRNHQSLFPLQAREISTHAVFLPFVLFSEWTHSLALRTVTPAHLSGTGLIRFILFITWPLTEASQDNNMSIRNLWSNFSL